MVFMERLLSTQSRTALVPNGLSEMTAGADGIASRGTQKITATIGYLCNQTGLPNERWSGEAGQNGPEQPSQEEVT
jgi:hypothetical protein